MNEKQENINNEEQVKNKFIISSHQQLNNHLQLVSNQQRFYEQSSDNQKDQTIKKKNQQIQELKNQNIKLKNNNKQLIKQLQIFSKKLDDELKKRAQQSQQKRPRINLTIQQKQSITIQNLYKKIEIYKKQISLLRSKLSDQNDIKLNDYENKLKLYMKQNEQLKDEIKSLKKIIKNQQIGLNDIGAQGFIKLKTQNQKQKQQLKKLKLQIDHIQRKYKLTHLLDNNNHKIKTPQSSNQSNNANYFNKQPIRKQFGSNKQIIQSRKKYLSQYTLKTQPQSLNKSFKGQQKQSQLNIIKSIDKNYQKLQSKIRSINVQRARQKQIIQNLKIQIIQKDKQMNYLKQKIQTLRKLVKSKKHKNHNDTIQKTIQTQNTYLQSIQQAPQRSQSNLNAQYHYSSQEMKLKQNNSHADKQRRSNQRKNHNRYPRLQQKGQKHQSSYKWNHHQFSSKIKEIQTYLHSKGHIYSIHARYQKGEPNKPIELQSRKFYALVCQSSDQYVQQISGGYKNGYLQFISLKTNHKRKIQFGNSTLENECENFTFTIYQNEYPCALFGQNDNDGVIRLGCFIDKL